MAVQERTWCWTRSGRSSKECGGSKLDIAGTNGPWRWFLDKWSVVLLRLKNDIVLFNVSWSNLTCTVSTLPSSLTQNYYNLHYITCSLIHVLAPIRVVISDNCRLVYTLAHLKVRIYDIKHGFKCYFCTSCTILIT